MTASVPRRACVLVLLAAAGLVAGCGGGNGGSSSQSTPAPKATQSPAKGTATPASKGKATTLDISAVEQNGGAKLSFKPATLQASAGKVTIRMDNPGSASLPHAVEIEGQGTPGAIVDPGGTSTATADLSAGKYTYFCPVDGHRQLGMQGTLTVK